MSYIGSTPTTQSFIAGTDYFNGTGSQTAFTLSRSVNSVNDIEAVINNVVQQPNTAYTVSGTTITFTSAPSSGSSNIYVRYLSTTTQSITPSQGTVGWNQLNADVKQDLGISFKNRIINGAMVIDQRNAGASVTASTTGAFVYTLDRYAYVASQASKFTIQQNAGSVTPPVGFTNYLGFTVGASANVTVGAVDYFSINQIIEGYNIADLGWGTANAKTVTLSFQVYSSLTGTFGGVLSNNVNYSYPFTYSIPVANTWTTISVTVAGPTSGTWLSTNGVGLRVLFDMGTGSSGRGTAGSWSANAYIGATGATNVIATNSATFYITGVQLEVGTQATTFDYRSYGTELALCQRYYSIFPVGAGAAYPSAAGALANSIYQFPVAMRTAPTVTAGSVSAETNCASDTFNGGGLAITYFGGAYQISQGGAGGNYNRYRMYNYASAEL